MIMNFPLIFRPLEEDALVMVGVGIVCDHFQTRGDIYVDGQARITPGLFINA